MRNLKSIYILAFLLLSLTGYSQKFGYIDTELILKKLPEYADAQKEIDKLAVNYQKEIEKKRVTLDSLYKVFHREEILLTEEMKRKKLENLTEKESEIREQQRKIFGFDGLIFLKRQELIEPIQDKVFEAVKKVAKKYKLQFIFDKSSDLSIIYASPTHDYTDFVLEQLDLGDKKDTIDNKNY
jgi:outer membrane protein